MLMYLAFLITADAVAGQMSLSDLVVSLSDHSMTSFCPTFRGNKRVWLILGQCQEDRALIKGSSQSPSTFTCSHRRQLHSQHC